MFTGLVEIAASVIGCRSEPPGCRLTVRWPGVGSQVRVGDSIAINGCCLTVVSVAGDDLEFEAGPETLRLTNLGPLRPGTKVNLERSLRVGDRLGGHFVTGHIDGVGTLEQRDDRGEWSYLRFRMPAVFASQVVAKGSISVDGVSLTVVDVEPERFSVMLIPHTLAMTTLGNLAAGDRVNLETDLLAKYVQAAVGSACTTH